MVEKPLFVGFCIKVDLGGVGGAWCRCGGMVYRYCDYLRGT